MSLWLFGKGALCAMNRRPPLAKRESNWKSVTSVAQLDPGLSDGASDTGPYLPAAIFQL